MPTGLVMLGQILVKQPVINPFHQVIAQELCRGNSNGTTDQLETEVFSGC